MWEPRRLTTLWAFTASYRDSFILLLLSSLLLRGTERRKDVEGGKEVGSGQKSLEKLRGSPLLLHRRQ
jgi:hypothetical protein